MPISKKGQTFCTLLFGVLSCVIGIALITLFFLLLGGFTDPFKEFYLLAPGNLQLAWSVFLAASLTVIPYGGFGIIAALRGPFLVPCFRVGNICLMLVFLAIAAISAVSMTAFQAALLSEDLCLNNQWTKALSTFDRQNQKAFCHYSDCACNLDATQTLFDEVFVLNSNSETKTIKDCATRFTNNDQAYQIMEYLENAYECSGFCFFNPIYMYNGKSIGNQPAYPKNKCSAVMVSKFMEKAELILIISGVASIVFFTFFIILYEGKETSEVQNRKSKLHPEID